MRFRFRRDSLIGGPSIAFADNVFAQTLTQFLSMRHRLNASRINGLHLFDQLENAIQMALRAKRFGFADLDTSEEGDALNLF
jgi:hypothetical protein